MIPNVFTSVFSVAVLAGACNICHANETKNAHGLKPTGLRTGLVAFDARGQPRIYKQGNEFKYEVNGRCVADGKEYPCQWRGFEFSYESPEEVTEFQCATRSDRPQAHVYPSKTVATNTKTLYWGFVVTGRKGHYLRPQYTIDLGNQPLRMAVSCSYKGAEVLKWEITLTP